MITRSLRIAILGLLVVAAGASSVTAQEGWDSRFEEEMRRAEEQAARARQRAEDEIRRAEERLARARERAADRAERAVERVENREARWERRRGDGFRLLVGRSYYLGKDDTVAKPVIVLGSSATIDGRAEDDVVVVGGRLKLGPQAVVLGDVVAVGGELDIDPAARIDGSREAVTIDIGNWGWSGWEWTDAAARRWWSTAGIVFTLGRMAIVLFLALLVGVVAPRWMADAEERVSRSAASSGIVGVMAEVLFAPALAVLVLCLVITIVGIPLLLGLPFLFAGLALMWVGGYGAVASVIGARLRGGRVAHVSAMNVAIGMLVLSGATLLGHAMRLGPDWLVPMGAVVRLVGWCVEYLGWTIGLGAALSAWRQRPQRGMEPPPVPPYPPLPTPEPSPSAL